MGRELGLVLFLAAGLALLAYDLFDLTSMVYRSRFLKGAALAVLVVLFITWAWRRRG